MKPSLSSAVVPNPAPLVFLITATACWALLADDPGPAGALWLWLLASCLTLAAIRLFTLRAEIAIVGLFASATMSHIYVEIGGLKARPEHVIIALLCIAAAFVAKRKAKNARWIFADRLVVGYIALNIVCSLTMSVEPAQTLKWALQQSLVIFPYFLVRLFAGDKEGFRRAVHILVAVGAFQSAYAIICFFSNLFFRTTFGVEIGQYGEFPGTYGTFYEANLLGSFTGACFVMSLVLYFKERRRVLLLVTALNFCGLIVALSRAALIATAVAAAATLIICVKNGLAERRVLQTLRTTILMAGLALAPVIVPVYVERFSTVKTSDIAADANTATRLLTLGAAVGDILDHPVLGNGTASFQLLVTYRELGFGDELADAGAWISNTEVRVLHDLGLVGLALFVWLLASVALEVRRILKLTPQVELLALSLSAIVYCIAFQMTEGTLLAFSWIHLGLIACGLALYKAENPSGSIAIGQLD